MLQLQPSLFLRGSNSTNFPAWSQITGEHVVLFNVFLCITLLNVTLIYVDYSVEHISNTHFFGSKRFRKNVSKEIADTCKHTYMSIGIYFTFLACLGHLLLRETSINYEIPMERHIPHQDYRGGKNSNENKNPLATKITLEKTLC